MGEYLSIPIAFKSVVHYAAFPEYAKCIDENVLISNFTFIERIKI